MTGPLGSDGYVVDFSVIKTAIRSTCKQLDERTLLPLFCDDVVVSRLASAPKLAAAGGETLSRTSEDKTGASSVASDAAEVAPRPHIVLQLANGDTFMVPEADVRLLPLSNISVEELAVYMCHEVAQALPVKELLQRGIRTLRIGVQETPNQKATFCIDFSKLAEVC